MGLREKNRRVASNETRRALTVPCKEPIFRFHDGFAWPVKALEGKSDAGCSGEIHAGKTSTNFTQCSLRHVPGDLDALQKGRSLNLERDFGRLEQGLDRSHSERKNQLPTQHLALTSSAASNYPLVLSQALFTKRLRTN
jgi:hypothetical protein